MPCQRWKCYLEKSSMSVAPAPAESLGGVGEERFAADDVGGFEKWRPTLTAWLATSDDDLLFNVTTRELEPVYTHISLWTTRSPLHLNIFTPPPFLHDYSRHFSFQSTSIHSALGAVLGVDALRRFMFYLFTYLLTFNIFFQAEPSGTISNDHGTSCNDSCISTVKG